MRLDATAMSSGEKSGSGTSTVSRIGSAVVNPLDPWQSWQRLSGSGPVATKQADAESPACWYLLGYQQMKLALADSDKFSSQKDPYKKTSTRFALIPGEIDPPVHRRYRSILNPLFSPPRIATREPDIRARCVELIDGFLESGSCEFMSEFAFLYPTSIFLGMLGLDVARCGEFVEYTHRFTRPANDADRSDVEASIDAILYELFQRRRRVPQDDLASHLLRAEIDDKPLAEDELLSIGRLLFIAGLDTVAATLGWSFLHLVSRQGDRAALVAHPELVPTAVEEFLRYYSVITSSRTLTEDTTMNGYPMHAGDTVIIPLAPANRDTTEYERGDEFVMDRAPNRHVGFGLGPHRCLGSHLARAELRVALEEWHARIPVYSIGQPGWTPTASGLEPLLGTGLSVPMLNSLPLSWDINERIG
jgi:cytochrome P450